MDNNVYKTYLYGGAYIVVYIYLVVIGTCRHQHPAIPKTNKNLLPKCRPTVAS